MVVLRKFEVKMTDEVVGGAFSEKTIYPVIALEKDQNAEVYEELYLLIPDDQGNLLWVSWNQIKVVSVEE